MYQTKELQELFLNYLNQQNFIQTPKELYDPIDYIMHLGGKRLRPVLLLMGYNLFQEDVQPALPTAMAIEILHNFSLVHDDIMDEAPIRRGKPTVHIKYNDNTAILSGDTMLILSYKYLNQLQQAKHLPEVLSIFNQVATEVCEGQQMDMNFETQNDVTIDAYLKMIELKTSVLIAGALQIGAIIGKASEEDARHLYEFGRNIGLAFQIQDDILDTFGDPDKFGKKTGGDIVQNKKTFLMLKALALATDTTKDNLLQLISTPTTDEVEKIKSVTQIYEALSVKDIATELMEKYLATAFESLNKVDVNDQKKQPLRNLANQLMFREV